MNLRLALLETISKVNGRATPGPTVDLAIQRCDFAEVEQCACPPNMSITRRHYRCVSSV